MPIDYNRWPEIAGEVTTGLIVTWLLCRVRPGSATDLDGRKVLQYRRAFEVLGVIGVCFFLVLLVTSQFMAPPKERVACAFVFGVGVVLNALWVRVTRRCIVTFTTEEIRYVPLVGRPFSFRWADIVAARFSPTAGWWVFRLANGRRARVSVYMDGNRDFIRSARLRLKIPIPVATMPWLESQAPFPFSTTAVRGQEAEGTLLRQRAELRSVGQVPVLVGDQESALRLIENWEANQVSAEAALGQVAALEPDAWLRARWEIDRDPEEAPGDQEIYDVAATPRTSLQVGQGSNGQMLPEVFLAKVPTGEFWSLPIYLRFGGWNACAEPVVHAALARKWEHRFGAKIAVITSDTVEFTVDRPPATPEEALQLAWEHYVYCADIVDQGVGSVPTLAKALQSSTRWFFWWD